MVHRRATPGDLIRIDGIAVTGLAQTILDLAAVVPLQEVEAALDSAVRRRPSVLEELAARLPEPGKGRGIRGTDAVRKLLMDRPSDVAACESPLEHEVLRFLLRNGLPKPVHQYVIKHRGRDIARVDFAYPEERIAIEVDSYRWHAGGKQVWEDDLARRNESEGLGWHVINITKRELRERPQQLIAEIKELRAGAHGQNGCP